MLKAQVSLGKIYIAKVSGKLTKVRLDRESQYGGWYATNLATQHEVRIKSAAKLRREVLPAAERRAMQQDDADLGGTF